MASQWFRSCTPIPLSLALLFLTAGIASGEEPWPPVVQAEAAVVVDVDSGRVLYEKNADALRRIASITKVMTAILAIEWGQLEEKVRISPKAARTPGSSIYLRAGERVPLIDLLYGLLLRSGNDAAVAIAEHLAGTEEEFVALMNQKAKSLGMTNTRFANAHGLDAEEDQYSTARDMALLAAYALKNPVFQEIVATPVKRVPWDGEEWPRLWYNKNKMLTLYEGADGVKTGYTRLAGRTLISSATREGRQLVAVTLNDPEDWRDHQRLLEYGFTNYSPKAVFRRGEEVAPPPGWKELPPSWKFHLQGDAVLPLAPGEEELLGWKWRDWTEQKKVKKAVKKGRFPQVVGHVEVRLPGEVMKLLPVTLVIEE